MRKGAPRVRCLGRFRVNSYSRTPQALLFRTRLDGGRYGNFRDWSGLKKRAKSRNDTFAKTSARNSSNMCI